MIGSSLSVYGRYTLILPSGSTFVLPFCKYTSYTAFAFFGKSGNGGKVEFPNGTEIETPDGAIINPDGSVTLPDGTEYDPNGNIKDKDVCKLDGKEINIDTDGDGIPDINLDLDGDCTPDRATISIYENHLYSLLLLLRPCFCFLHYQ